MKLEDLKVGQYIRLNYGTIDKILKFNENYVKGVLQKGTPIAYDRDNIIKASDNIIDLMEVKDIIKIDVTDEDNYSHILGINFIRIENERDLLNIKDMVLNGSAKLIQIATHQQFEQIAYKVEE